MRITIEAVITREEIEKRVTGALASRVGATIARLGGRLQCRQCGRRVQVAGRHALYLQHGWPMCCGETIEWLTDAQLEGGDYDEWGSQGYGGA